MNREFLYTQKIRNAFHTLIILLSLMGIIGILGWMLAGIDGVFFAFFIGLVTFIISPHLSPRLILRATRARELSPYNFDHIYQITRDLAIKAGLNYMPGLYQIPNPEMNAFAVGSEKNAAIGLTDGLLQSLNTRELAGIIGHEIAHIKNNDLKVIGLADIAGRITHMLSTFGQIAVLLAILFGGFQFSLIPLLILVFAPTITLFLQLALSRTREFEADLVSAQLTGDTYGLASALKKLEAFQQSFWKRLLIPSWYSSQPSLLRTHPLTKERIERLLAMGNIKSQHIQQMQPVYAPTRNYRQPASQKRYVIKPWWY